MTAPTDPLMDRLRAAHAGVPAASPASRDAIRDQLLTTTEATPMRAPRRWAGRRRLGLRAAGTVAVLGAAVACTFALLPARTSQRLGSPGVELARAAEQRCSDPAPTQQASAACLNALGAVAGDWQVPGSGDVLYQRSWWNTGALHMGPGGPNTAKPGERGFYMATRGAEKELWLRLDGSGESLQHAEGAGALLPSAADRAAWTAAGRPTLQFGRPQTGDEINMMGPGSARQSWAAGERTAELFPAGETNDGNGQPALLRSGDPVKEFSTDPAVLTGQIRRFAWRQRIELSGEPRCALDLHDCQPATRRNILSNEGTVAVALLQYPAAPRALRAAVLEVLARTPGHRALGAATDSYGRRGVTVRLPQGSNDGQNILLLDASTARLLAIGSSDDGSRRATRWFQVLNLAVGRVAQVGQRPEKAPRRERARRP